ncbi:MAG: ECF transporter S component [Clostridia bacterium]|nr:ECF transporter S component [Clostridia bacterium]
MEAKMKKTTRQIVLSGLFIALGLLMPFLTAQIPTIGSRLLPMHIPILICGFVCGWRSGLLVGLVTPLLRSVLFGMPPMFPVAIAMAFELGTYGFITGLLYEKLKGGQFKIILVLILAMIAGRITWGIAMFALLNLDHGTFTLTMFVNGAWINAIPGIILQLLFIPTLLISLQRAKVLEYEQ